MTQLAEQIAREIIYDIINDIVVEDKKKKKKRGKRGGKAHKKKFIYDLKKENNPEFHLATRPNHTSGRPYHKITVEHLPDFEFVDFYDTPLWDETEGVLQTYLSETQGDMKVAQIPSEVFGECLEKFLEWMKLLPMNVILYADPLAHNLIVGMMNFQMDFNIVLSMNYICFAFKGEDYHYSTTAMDERSWVNSHVNKIKEGSPFSVATRECVICCETPPPDPSSSTSPHGMSICQSCGQEACHKCINKFLMKQCELKVMTHRITGQKKASLKKPEYTCPFCRGGHYFPTDKSHIPNGFLKGINRIIASENGEDIPERSLQDENREVMIDFIAEQGFVVDYE